MAEKEEIKTGEQAEATEKVAEVAVEETKGAEETTEKAAPAAEAEPESEEEKQKKRDAFERRKEKKRLHDLEIENARLRGVQEGIQLASKEKEKPAPEVVKPTRPKEADFATTAEFDAAMDKYEDDRDAWKEHEKAKKAPPAAPAPAERTASTVLVENVNKQLEAGKKEYADFEEVVQENPDFKQSPLMVAAIARKANGHDIIYFLGKNIEEADRLRVITDPVELGEALADISSKVKEFVKTAKKPAGAPAAKKETTKAPAPAATVGAKTKVSTDTSLEGKSQEERMKILEARSIENRRSGRWQRL